MKIFIWFITMILVGCGSNPVSKNQEQNHFAAAYYYYDKPIEVNPDKDIILFFRRGQVLTPFLTVVDGKFLPSSSGVVNYERIKKIQVFAMADTWAGGARIMTGQQAEFKITACSYRHFLPTDKRYDSIGVYSNRRFPVEIKDTPNRCVMDVEVGGDTYDASVCVGTSEWKTDLNGNGKPETWIAFPQGQWIQVWENYGQSESALIVDTAHPALPNPDRQTCDNSSLFRNY